LCLFFLPLAHSLVLWVTTSDGASLSLLGVASLLPRVGQSLAASLLVSYSVATLHNSSAVYLKMKLCSPWRGFHMRCSGHTPVSPWRACR
jgi:hypothetical protein